MGSSRASCPSRMAATRASRICVCRLACSLRRIWTSQSRKGPPPRAPILKANVASAIPSRLLAFWLSSCSFGTPEAEGRHPPMSEPQPRYRRPRPGTRSRPRPATCAPAAAASKSISRTARVRYIEGNRDHPVNQGVICGKGASGIMQHYSPARLSKPLLRVGERGSGEFREIEWEEALATATQWLSRSPQHAIRASSPSSPAATRARRLTGWWATQFGTPNYAAHGGFCSVNMAAAGLYTFGGSFWEFGEPDWKHTKYFLMFGVAEDHASNPIKIGPRPAQGARRQVRLGQSGAHRLFGDRRRMDRHPSRHRRAVRAGADPRAAARRARSISTISPATPMRPGW